MTVRATMPSVRRAASSAANASTSPVAITRRSPSRSASAPHSTSVDTSPTVTLASSTPRPVRPRPYSVRSSGASPGSPCRTAAELAWATTPAPRTTQR